MGPPNAAASLSCPSSSRRGVLRFGLGAAVAALAMPLGQAQAASVRRTSFSNVADLTHRLGTQFPLFPGAPLGGFGLGASAPELLLGALASCLAHSALVIAADRGIALDELEVDVSGQLDYRGTLSVDDTTPVAPTDLRYMVRITSPCDDAELAQLHADLERLCPVLLAITRPTSVAGRIERHGDA